MSNILPANAQRKVSPRAKDAPKNYYFTKEHEEAIIEYASASYQRRSELYKKMIEPVFSEMVDKIVYTFKFTSIPNIDSLREECKIWLTTVIEKFNPEKGYTAFAYFSVITKNWFIHKVKKNSRSCQKEVNFDDVYKHKSIEFEYFSVPNPYIAIREKEEWWAAFEEMLVSWEDLPMKPTEKKVYEAIRILFESSDQISIFNKKAVYLYIREITGLSTKQIIQSLNKLRERYLSWKREDITHGEYA
jgi:hypothetical protein